MTCTVVTDCTSVLEVILTLCHLMVMLVDVSFGKHNGFCGHKLFHLLVQWRRWTFLQYRSDCVILLPKKISRSPHKLQNEMSSLWGLGLFKFRPPVAHLNSGPPVPPLPSLLMLTLGYESCQGCDSPGLCALTHSVPSSSDGFPSSPSPLYFPRTSHVQDIT